MAYFLNRSEIAAYLQISRMTLSRWEKIVPLPLEFGASHIGRMEDTKINAWYQKLHSKHRPYHSYQKGKITAEK